ncbi:MAG: hypothetical protein KDE22_01570 [Rhodobacterales bacterium]|nr:hypothetical protein [Rhodobacterales bacterium]
MKRSTLLLVAASAVIVVGGTALSTVASADRGWGPGYGSGPCMGPGQGRGYDDDDRGKRGFNRGGWDRDDRRGGPGPRMFRGDRDFTADEVRTLAEARMIMRGNPNLKVGTVTKKDDDTYTVTIVTKDDSLVREYEVSKKTGFPVRGFRR